MAAVLNAIIRANVPMGEPGGGVSGGCSKKKKRKCGSGGGTVSCCIIDDADSAYSDAMNVSALHTMGSSDA